MFVPLRLCPPLVRLVSLSSIGNGDRPGRYVTLLGPLIIVPVFVYVHDCLHNQNMVHMYVYEMSKHYVHTIQYIDNVKIGYP